MYQISKGEQTKECFFAGVPEAFSLEKILILGAGKFGSIAARRLTRRYPQASFLVVDMDEKRLKQIEKKYGHPTLRGEAIPYLSRQSQVEDIWIIPAIPIHVAFEWLLFELKKKGSAKPIPVPEALDRQVPNPFRMDDQTLYTSFAAFTCPDACNEPDDICTHTGKPRPGNLYENLMKAKLADFDMVMIRSLQLAPGVGGYPASCLRQIYWRVMSKSGRYLVATSCRCHGVINALRWLES